MPGNVHGRRRENVNIMGGSDDSSEDCDTVPSRDEIIARNAELRSKVIENFKRNKNCPGVWLLVGMPSSGKSAFVNTIRKEVAGNFKIVADVGKGETKTKTRKLIEYKNCAVGPTDFENADNGDKLSGVHNKLPTIWDIWGITDDDSNKTKEYLQMVVEGRVCPGTSIIDVEYEQHRIGVGNLRQHYTTVHREWQVTKILFVQAGNADVPRKLIKCIREIIDESNRGSIKVFTVLTKYDLVEEQRNFTVGRNCNPFPMSTLEDVERQLAAGFSYGGMEDYYSSRVVNYVDGMGRDDPFIDNLVLELLEKIQLHVQNNPSWVRWAMDLKWLLLPVLAVVLAALAFIVKLVLDPDFDINTYFNGFLSTTTTDTTTNTTTYTTANTTHHD